MAECRVEHTNTFLHVGQNVCLAYVIPDKKKMKKKTKRKHNRAEAETTIKAQQNNRKKTRTHTSEIYMFERSRNYCHIGNFIVRFIWPKRILAEKRTNYE